jgi:hypothetical protein
MKLLVFVCPSLAMLFYVFAIATSYNASQASASYLSSSALWFTFGSIMMVASIMAAYALGQAQSKTSSHQTNDRAG